MKVYIDPYKNYRNIYWFIGKLTKLGVNEEVCDKIAEKLDYECLGRIFGFFNKINDRKVKIKIHNYDTWDMDQTLAMIILPMLKQLKETKHGGPHVDDSDVPDELKSTSAPEKENEWDIDANFFKRWDYVMDLMIWTFEQLTDEEGDLKFYNNGTHDWEALTGYNEKIEEGLRLFGKYYRGLRD